jgi:hypothetical protein
VAHMSAIGTLRTSEACQSLSVFGGMAGIRADVLECR